MINEECTDSNILIVVSNHTNHVYKTGYSSFTLCSRINVLYLTCTSKRILHQVKRQSDLRFYPLFVLLTLPSRIQTFCCYAIILVVWKYCTLYGGGIQLAAFYQRYSPNILIPELCLGLLGKVDFTQKKYETSRNTIIRITRIPMAPNY